MRNTPPRIRDRQRRARGFAVSALVALGALACVGRAGATGEARLPDDASPEVAEPAEKRFKFTAGYYGYSSGGPGRDVNLRYRSGFGAVWLGNYGDPQFGEQARAGWESAYEPLPGVPLSLQPSIQVAAGHFVGGSLTAEFGAPWFALAGIGRTNLKPYFNLNFDPNDNLTIAFGHRAAGGHTLYAMLVADNRLGTGQRNLHLVARLPVADRQRLTLDVLHKSGEGDEGMVRAWGATLTWDSPSWFVRLARDPKQNYSGVDATRLSVGTRF